MGASEESGICTVEAVHETREYEEFGDGFRVTARTVVPVPRPLFLPDEIRLGPAIAGLGRAATVFMPDLPPFQAWIRPAYAISELAAILAEADRKPRPPRLRQQPLTRHSHVSPPGGSADPMNMTVDELRNQIEQVKADLDWANTTGSARTWWEDFENANIERLPLVLKLAEDLHQLKATIHEFFLAYASSNIDSIQGNLNYLAYLRFKKGEEQKKRGKRRNKT